MSKFKDLTGLKFNRWTVIKQGVKKNGYTYWVCQCECLGTSSLKEVIGASLVNGTSKSCGCTKRVFTDLFGLKFNKLTVLNLSDEQISDKNGDKLWDCKCDCGSDLMVQVKTYSLVNNMKKSCGCLVKEVLFKKGYTRNTNTYELHSDYAIIKTYDLKNNTHNCFIDIEDLNMLKLYTWHCNPQGYFLSCTFGNINLRMHRLLMNIHNESGDIEVDHKDGNPSNNRKDNLRLVTNQQNTFNTKLSKRNSHGIKGLWWDKNREKWVPKIYKDGKSIFLGRFNNIEDARLAREKAELELFGEYSALHRKMQTTTQD